MVPVRKTATGEYAETQTFACPNAQACLGNNACGELKVGVFCQSCVCLDWNECYTTFPGLGPQCFKCIDSTQRVLMMIFALIVAGLGLWIVIRILLSGSTKLKDLTSPGLKIFFSYFQMAYGVLLVSDLVERFDIEAYSDFLAK